MVRRYVILGNLPIDFHKCYAVIIDLCTMLIYDKEYVATPEVKIIDEYFSKI